MLLGVVKTVSARFLFNYKFNEKLKKKINLNPVAMRTTFYNYFVQLK